MIEFAKELDNSFGKTSHVLVRASVNAGGESYLQDLSFSAPYKIVSPFKGPHGMMRLMLMSASAGIMSGDQQDFTFIIDEGAKVEYISQAYEKIHQMTGPGASRVTRVEVAKGSNFIFNPQPTIPFKDSDFTNRTDINLEDSTAKFFMSEILCSGRALRGENFQYKKFHNLVHIYRDHRLIYRDNSRFTCDQPMTGLGMYEGYSHMGNIFMTASYFEGVEDVEERFLSLLERDDLEGGFTRLASGDYVMRLFANRAQVLEAFVEDLVQTYNVRG